MELTRLTAKKQAALKSKVCRAFLSVEVSVKHVAFYCVLFIPSRSKGIDRLKMPHNALEYPWWFVYAREHSGSNIIIGTNASFRGGNENKEALIKELQCIVRRENAKLLEPVIVINNNLRQAKQAAQDFVMSVTCGWVVLQEELVCASAGYTDRLGSGSWEQRRVRFISFVRTAMSQTTRIAAGRK